MATIQQEDFQRIAQLIEARSAFNNELRDQLENGYSASFEGGSVPVPPITIWRAVYRDTGLNVDDYFNTETGFDLAVDFRALQYLDSKGQINGDEAQAFLRRKYGGELEFSGRAFTTQADPVEVDIATESEKPSDDPSKKGPNEEALAARELVQPGAGAGGPYSSVAINVPRIPQGEITQDVLRRTLNDMADQMSLQLSQLKSGQINYRQNSIDGRALRPGSVALEKVQRNAFYDELRAWPGPKEAVTLELRHDKSIDRNIDSNGVVLDIGGVSEEQVGPGRVWNVRRWGYPSVGYKVGPGPVRYRVILEGQPLTILSVTENGGAYRVRYGMVIRNIPLFWERPPSAIAAIMLADSDSPVSMAGTLNPGGLNLSGTLQWPEDSKPHFFTTPPRGLVPYNRVSGSAGRFLPSQTEIDEGWRGIQASVITGNTAKQVYGQLHGMPDGAGQLYGEPLPPTVVFPEHVEPRGITTPVWTFGTVSGGVLYHSWATSFSFGTWAQRAKTTTGMPFSIRDCGTLAPTVPGSGGIGSFSVAIALDLDVEITAIDMKSYATSGSGDMHPATWWGQGVVFESLGHRRTAIDLVVV